MEFKELIEDVRAGRCKIQNIFHSCQGDPQIIVAFTDGLEILVTAQEAQELLRARDASKLTFSDLLDALG